MMGIRLLMAISLISSASAFAQMQNDSSTPANQAATPIAAQIATQNPSPFKIDQLSDPFLPEQNTESPRLLLEPFPQHSKEDEVLLKLNYGDLAANLNPDARMVVPGDSYCLKIRSYVVARDSKNSDSVHPAGYTTCVPATRFRLRTTEEHQSSAGDLHLVQR